MMEKLRIYLILCILCSWVGDAVTSKGQPWTEYPILNCTFDLDKKCSWRQAGSWYELNWAMSQKYPDHTTGDGYYLRLKVEEKATSLIGRIQSPPVQSSNETCLSFWYFMQDNGVELVVHRLGPGEGELLRIVGSQGNKWYQALVPTGSGDFQLLIVGSVATKAILTGTGLDDISFSYRKCPEDELKRLADEPRRIACDFEEDLCNWYDNGYSRSTSWVHRVFGPDTKDRNPVPPFSNGNGTVEVTRGRETAYNTEAQLQGRTISVDRDEACFSFWYKIEGKKVYSLEMRLKGHREIGDPVTVYTSRQPKRPTWIQAKVTLPERENFFIILSAMHQRRKKGTCLIDDINISYGGPCPEENQEDLINCDFDKNLCRWYMTTETDENDWARLKGPTPSDSTGPPHDHTTGDGYYVFLDASKVEDAHLYSQDISVDHRGACFSFWYYMYGEDVYKLELHVQGDPFSTERVWSLEGGQENQWIQQNVSLAPFRRETARLLFRAQSAYFPRGDIALDDISITFGSVCQSDIPEPIEPEYVVTDYVEPATTSISTSVMPEIIELPTPTLIIKDGLTTVYENSHVELECQADTNVTVLTSWYREREGRTELVNREGYDNILVFDDMQAKDGGNFSCAISFYSQESTTQVSNYVTIKVVPDPRRKPDLYVVYISTSRSNHKHGVGETISLACGDLDVKGADYLWKTTSLAFVDVPLPNSQILLVNDSQVEHSGVYSCRIRKDGFMTGKSRESLVEVVPGKPCDYNWECRGNEYKEKCVKKRCRCAKNAAPNGPRCLFKPERPKIMTFPRFLEYAIGESFYVMCRAKTPAPADLRYTFITPKGSIESYDIMKINHATSEDSGFYSCFVKHRNVTSSHSDNIVVQIKDFVDLNCDFRKDLCKWSQRNGSGLASFDRSSGKDVSPDSKSKHLVAFIQVSKSDTDRPNKAVLISPTIDRTTLNSCLTFDYRMMGSDVHALSVWVYKFAERLHEDGGTRLLTAIGEKGKKWMKKDVTIPPGDDFFIVFEAIGTVAIADIRFVYRGGC